MVDGREDKAQLAAERARAKALRPWYKKKRFIIPLVLVALLVIASLGGGADKEKGSTNSAPAPGPAATEDTAAPTTKGGGEARLFPGRPDYKRKDKERNIGQPADLSGYTVTVTQAAFQQQLNQFQSDGYLVAEVTLLNRDAKAQSYNLFNWKLITPSGQIIDPCIVCGEQLGSGDLAQGGTVSGRLVWETKGQHGDFYVIYDPPDFGEERAVWKATA